ncbi:hypothetical protein CI088_07810 [Enterococcus plantarum]|uniref:Uncharacterized protein n=1 Tax=Enterococcus plantarum TaxID=1077675 RepID=A0A2W3ZZD5_9ENTE|nr:hypothetical protein [Enterococcus plantarum]PZL74093.1 hypothetical protein CI088_07810 [Enterococcus plantarum]
MARKKKEVDEVIENVIEGSGDETKKTKAAKKETEIVPEVVSTETNDEEIIESVVPNKEVLVPTNNPIERQTPFGKEVWDPIEKRTVLKNG